MKTNKILQVLLIIAATCFLSSCIGGSSLSNDESFWEGKVRPGTYSSYCYGWHHDPNRYERKTNVTFTIYDNKDIKIKEGSDVFYGTLHKYVEIYNGERKVWYGAHAEQEGTTWVTEFNLSTDLLYSPGDCKTYQEFSYSQQDSH